MVVKKKEKKPSPKSGADSGVEDYLAALKHPHKEGILALRKAILSVDPRIREEVKWNAPSFYISEHFATFRVKPEPMLQIILHTGAKSKAKPKRFDVPDPDGLLKWAAPDRCIVTFSSSTDALKKKPAFLNILRAWIDQL